MFRSFLSDNKRQKTPNFEGPELQFEADQVFRRSRTPFELRSNRHSISKADSIRRKPFADGFLEEISKVWNVTELQSFLFVVLQFPRCFLDGIWDSEGPRLTRRIIDEISKLPNTTGLNFEDSASEHNFENLWLSGCFLKDFEEGVPYIDGHTNEQFILRVHLLTWIGDIPALSKSLNLTGHNSYKACRFCMIKKICHPLNYHIYYPSSDIVYNIRNHDDTVNMAKLIDNETIKIQKNNMIKETGRIKESTLQMYTHWTGKFFNNSQMSNDYELLKSQWEIISAQMEKIKKDMPNDIERPP
ncbi:hypothetical protein RclHR1_10440001 [Rhizophagus clarus]|uniref:Uncharacterized protein n=1 Tax=Rhizophagus clarus TaxID=94130 RepID=A0A2Z6QSS8_9GLOM|nr:hypothetical protein RclHR1_10440001 [Rhizophagus clarus]